MQKIGCNVQFQLENACQTRAFSDLFGKFLVPMKLEKKNCVILERNTTILGKNSAIFSKIGKVYLLNWDFSANWECSRSIGYIFSQLGKIWYRKPDPVLCREKALHTLPVLTIIAKFYLYVKSPKLLHD